MKIGIVGAGKVGGKLGELWAARGHEIVYGARNPNSENCRAALAATPGARAASIKEAVAFGEVVVVAMRWGGAIEEVLPNAGDWSGKIVIDLTNRRPPPPEDSAGSAAQDMARLAPGARVVKAFNCIGYEHYGNPDFGGQAAGLFICGHDVEARAVVSGLGSELGFDVVDCGPLENARHVEALGAFWIMLSGTEMGRDVAFKLLRR